MGGTLYFRADDGTHGVELWRSDGTAAGTVLVRDIRPGFYSSSPGSLTAVGGTLYFRASDGTHGEELWRSDGTAAGTLLVKDIYSGGGSSYPWYLTAMGGTLYFRADDGTHGVELWRSDGTAAGTVLVADINPGGGSSNPRYLTAVGGTLYFSADNGSNGRELWRTPLLSRLVFRIQPPTSVTVGQAFRVQVQLLDEDGNAFALSNVAVRLRLESGSGLSGVVVKRTSAAGLATFGGLSLTVPGRYRLVARLGNGMQVMSRAIVVS
jgi:ELWxxDGT repeat protein